MEELDGIERVNKMLEQETEAAPSAGTTVTTVAVTDPTPITPPPDTEIPEVKDEVLDSKTKKARPSAITTTSSPVVLARIASWVEDSLGRTYPVDAQGKRLIQ